MHGYPSHRCYRGVLCVDIPPIDVIEECCEQLITSAQTGHVYRVIIIVLSDAWLHANS